jgi:hypothetical protein
LFCRPQLVQKAKLGGVAGVAETCIFWPQFVQKAMPAGTSVWQAMQVRVTG